MALIDDIKICVKIDGTESDADLKTTIEACKSDMELHGVHQSRIVDTDPIIVRAIKLYCKADISSDANESVRYQTSYEKLRDHLSLTEYAEEKVTTEESESFD